MLSNRLPLILLALTLAVVAARDARATKHLVQMINLTFVPADLMGVEVGDTVRWENASAFTHTTTSGTPCTADGKWNSGDMTQGMVFEVEIKTAGTQDYFCMPHCGLQMRGTIEAEEKPTGVTPSHPAFQLHQNHPNPFNPSTTITYSIELPAHVEIDVYDVHGRFVDRVESASRPAGAFTADWDATSYRGERVASGIYFYQLVLNGVAVEMRKMVLLK